MSPQEIPSHSPERLQIIDLARGVALVAMTTFHFGWDIEMFGFVDPGFASQPSMIWYARCIASTFLFLVGFSLVMAHSPKIKWHSFFKRWLLIAGAAGVITFATIFATPEVFIFFGILHHIALASLLGLLFVRLPALACLLAAAGVLIVFAYGKSDLFDAPFWWWSGLNATIPRSTDYVPIFPFFAAVLTGMATAKILVRHGLLIRIGAWQFNRKIAATLKFIGRHSLVYYLVHQPIMIAFLLLVQFVIRIF